jgi:hypothetical protein
LGALAIVPIEMHKVVFAKTQQSQNCE